MEKKICKIGKDEFSKRLEEFQKCMIEKRDCDYCSTNSNWNVDWPQIFDWLKCDKINVKKTKYTNYARDRRGDLLRDRNGNPIKKENLTWRQKKSISRDG